MRKNYNVLDFRTIITWSVVAILFFTLIFEDRINGYVARKRMLPGLEKATVTFKFIFSQSHAQIYSKNSIIGGTIEAFREFIKNATGKEIQKV